MKMFAHNFFKTLNIIFLILLYSCATNDIDGRGGNLKYDKVCDVETRILKSYGDTVRIEYEPTKMMSADNMASEYCITYRNKTSTKNEVSCDGCCRATFICKTISN